MVANASPVSRIRLKENEAEEETIRQKAATSAQKQALRARLPLCVPTAAAGPYLACSRLASLACERLADRVLVMDWAELLASLLLKTAMDSEPMLTSMLEELSASMSGSLKQLEHRFKVRTSLVQKIRRFSRSLSMGQFKRVGVAVAESASMRECEATVARLHAQASGTHLVRMVA